MKLCIRRGAILFSALQGITPQFTVYVAIRCNGVERTGHTLICLASLDKAVTHSVGYSTAYMGVNAWEVGQKEYITTFSALTARSFFRVETQSVRASIFWTYCSDGR